MRAERPRSSDNTTDALWTLVSAGLFLYVGFGLGLTTGNPEPLVNQAVLALTWGSRIIGFGLLAMALATFAGSAIPALVDFLVSFAASALCLSVGAIFAYHEYQQGYLIGLFGLMNAISTRHAWLRWRASTRASQPEPPENST